MMPHKHMRGVTTHARRGAISNAFTYGVDYLLIDPDETRDFFPLFSRNSHGLMSLYDSDHGGRRGRGDGVSWAQKSLATAGLPTSGLKILLLAQPRFLGFWFNPVAFWMAFRDGALVAVIAEVNNTMGDRHSYLCANPDFAPITGSELIRAEKVFHVSPFQDVSGEYRFKFRVTPDRIAITIDFVDGNKGLVATLNGPVVPLSVLGLTAASLRRPAGALRVMVLILWQAAKLKLKGARFRKRPEPPREELT